MATLRDFDYNKNEKISDIKTKYNLKCFIETGTGYGETIEYCLNQNFEEIYSIEIWPEIYNRSKEKFKNYNNCYILNGKSVDVLPTILIPKIEYNILFFLDAHFPGADFKFKKYEDIEDENISLPLETEFKTITEIRDIKNDVFIIDDLWLYEEGPFQAGRWEIKDKIKELLNKNINFIYEKVKDTHIIEKDYRYQGFLIIKPKI